MTDFAADLARLEPIVTRARARLGIRPEERLEELMRAQRDGGRENGSGGARAGRDLRDDLRALRDSAAATPATPWHVLCSSDHAMR